MTSTAKTVVLSDPKQSQNISSLQDDDCKLGSNSRGNYHHNSDDLVEQLESLSLESPKKQLLSIEIERKLAKDWYMQQLQKLVDVDFYSLSQRSNEWLEARSKLLTASSFAVALMMWRGQYGVTRFQEFFNEKVGMGEPFAGNEKTEWGTKHEPIALEAYKSVTGFKVEQMGMVVGKQGEDCFWIGGSPDGLITGIEEEKDISSLSDEAINKSLQILKKGEPGILEIKCPHSQRLNSNVEYYMLQIQGLMQLQNYKWAHLYVWTPKKSVIYFIERHDIQWGFILPQLHKIWFNHVVPAMWSWQAYGSETEVNRFQVSEEERTKSYKLAWFRSWYQLKDNLVKGEIITA
eukprot:TRINITY_DN8099_c0_g2_i4.p1 TRINITY_DN8099_c0_g2~~TRINITY_DN8099_c0_g2_i4.p1  ORF type:complete len:391 (-),score=38.75 TRINITY_DN8099_c0_g2_i4:377-1420(-)